MVGAEADNVNGQFLKPKIGKLELNLRRPFVKTFELKGSCGINSRGKFLEA